MVLKQYYLGCLAHASYLIADEASGRAAVVDPQRDVEQYLADAAGLGCRISDVLLTHFHADFVAGHLELRERAGAVIRLGARAEAEYSFIGMGDGDSVVFGDVRLSVLETPGHSPESISILVYERGENGGEPYAVLTGDTLFIGDVGRPDLRGAQGWGAEELAGTLYDSLHEKLMRLPDATLVYPAHGAGSLCGKSLSSETVSTIGAQRADNYALAPMRRERFIEIVTTDLPDAPAYFTYDAALNTREHPTLEQTLARELRPLALTKVLKLAEDGAQLLDTREPAKFEGAHLKGSINVGLNGSYATWCGTLLDPERPIVVIAEPGREGEAATRLGRIAFDGIAGYLAGGMQTLADRPGLVARIERITAGTLAERLAGPDPPLLIDVRAPGEWQAERIEAAVNLPLSRWPERMITLPQDESIVVHCGTGYRSAIAASLLQRDGYTLVSDLIGGIEAWPTD
ncbi:MAG TPA: MBL fold metallo-hydrolase [Solirubrobacteraceae bacterium]|nr:MBL fold metallo-hydrolase [Solirubrobacteraceae bacterium]